MEEKKIEERLDVSGNTQETAKKPRYNKTWEAVLKYRGTVKVNDPSLYYR